MSLPSLLLFICALCVSFQPSSSWDTAPPLPCTFDRDTIGALRSWWIGEEDDASKLMLRCTASEGGEALGASMGMFAGTTVGTSIAAEIGRRVGAVVGGEETGELVGKTVGAFGGGVLGIMMGSSMGRTAAEWSVSHFFHGKTRESVLQQCLDLLDMEPV